MPRLVLLNGAPGSGKSTLARRFVRDHPLALALDIDTVRTMLGGWIDQPVASGRLACELALEMARVHLTAGLDVVVPQFLSDVDFVVMLEEVADRCGAPFVEVVLLSNPQDAVDRFRRRSAEPGTTEHRAARDLQARAGGPDAVAEAYARLLELVAARPATRRIVTVDGEVDRAYRDLLVATGSRPPPTSPDGRPPSISG